MEVACSFGAAGTPQPVKKLNALAFVAPSTLWINVWQSNRLVRFDLKSQKCDKWLDLDPLLPWSAVQTESLLPRRDIPANR